MFASIQFQGRKLSKRLFLGMLLFSVLSISLLQIQPKNAEALTLPVSIVIDHTSVDLFDDIPQEYIDKVKTMRLNVLGESHSRGYIFGDAFVLEKYGSKYATQYSMDAVSDTDPVTGKFRADRVRYENGSWINSTGEEEWYTNRTGVDKVRAHLDWNNKNNHKIDAMLFGWCWDMTWTNSPGGTVDPVYGVRWAGSSEGGPEGNKIWGLDEDDVALTGNSVTMKTYLNATEEYQTAAETAGQGTAVVFTTGPVDGGGNTGENGYQRHLKNQYIRDYVKSNNRVLFDYADILTHNDAGTVNNITWSGHTYDYIHSDNMKDYRATTCGANPSPCAHTEDGDHIGEVGALRLGKAQWVLMARLAGWDGQPTTTDPSAKQPVYRFWSDKYKGHFFTISVAEKESVEKNYPQSIWKYEGVAWSANPNETTGLLPVYRFWSDTYRHHFFTISVTEKDYINKNYPTNVWRYEGISWYANPTEISGQIPVYRFWSDTYKSHFFTISVAEKDSIETTYASNVWRYEGIAYYVSQ